MLVLVHPDQGAAHVGAEVGEGDDVSVRANTSLSPFPKLDKKALLPLQGILEVQRLSLLEFGQGGDPLSGERGQYHGGRLTSIRGGRFAVAIAAGGQ